MNRLPQLVLIACVLLGGSNALRADWLALPGRYTHDAATGKRVDQYAPPEPAVAPRFADFRTSGFTHARSSIQFNQSSDNYHRVEKWGEPIRPYGEWRFPYRPYSVPYGAWGPPFAGLGNDFYFGGRGPRGGRGGGWPPGHGGADGDLPNQPYPPVPDGGYQVPPYYDGGYPRDRQRLDDEDFFDRPSAVSGPDAPRPAESWRGSMAD